MDRLTAAKVFVDVASTQSFTTTADRLDMSRPMVTRYIDALESWLNARLLHRTTRKVSLTSAGERCLPQVQGWIEQAQDLQHQLMAQNELSGRLRVSTSMSFGFAQLIPAVKGFIDRHRQVEMDIDVQETAVDLIAERIDLAIRITPSPDPSLIGRPIATCDSILVASPSYLNSAPQITEPADLFAHQCLGHQSFERHIWNLRHGQRHESVEVNCQLRSNEATVLLNAAVNGMGVSLQPTYLANSALKRGALVQVLPQWQPKVMDIYALYPSRKHLSPAVRSLIDHLIDYFANEEWQDLQL